ncbi:sensor histidine kinase [Chondrinema litorale]|uniref:sensor histidine kinase n=1 Tax=Chondrinema litorale TaxID=2994555 RepID=UPI002543ED0D|nr:7TM diverse intracellular signaling domain-containing protein [Chondrinema litorale]UZR96021.1 ATP-binding protein [Chondrinema litorale]
MRFNLTLFFLFTVQCLLAHQTQGKNIPFSIDKEAKYYVIPFKHIEILKDKSKSLDIFDVRDGVYSQNFFTYKSYDQVNSFEEAWWCRFSLQNNTKSFFDWKMYIGFNNIIDVYIHRPNNQVIHKRGGQYVPSSERDVIEGRVSSFNLGMEPGDLVTIYIRVENINHRLPYFEPVVVNSSYWNKSIQKRNLFEGIFYGIMLIMVFYNAFIFLSYQDKTYIYYAGYILNVSFYFFVLKGFTREYFFQENPLLEAYGWQIALGLSPIFYFQFVRTYLSLKELVPTWNKIIKYAELFCAVVLAIQLVITYFTFNIQFVGTIAYFILISQAIFSLILLSILVKTRNKLAYYIAAGSLCLWTGGIIGLYFTVTEYFMDGLVYGQYGVIAEVLIFSLGLGYRMRENKTEKENAQKALINQFKENEKLQIQINQKLEAKVIERTKALQKKTIQLEQRNEEVTAQRDLLELQNKEIEEKRNMLMQLNEDKNHLIGIVAHDLRNPLSTALSMSELVYSDGDNLDDDQKSSVNLISRSLRRMNEMIEKILDMRAIEAKKINMHFEKTDVAEMVMQVTESFKSEANKKNILFKIETEKVKANVDKSYLIQILENLISNALKFSPFDSNIIVKQYLKEDKLLIVIKDKGPGLTKEDHQKLFGKFQRLSAKPTNGEPSTGLGLSIVKKYIEAMNGKIWCESNYGEGASFIIELQNK